MQRLPRCPGAKSTATIGWGSKRKHISRPLTLAIASMALGRSALARRLVGPVSLSADMVSNGGSCAPTPAHVAPTQLVAPNAYASAENSHNACDNVANALYALDCWHVRDSDPYPNGVIA